jgi:type II secretory ATPase GspE/PulE/Tfp pilus assembly ATPase PilB-like protein
VTDEELRALEMSEDEKKYLGAQELKTAFRSKGCDACNFTGYMGRTVVGEIMVVNDEIKEMISEGASLNKLKDAALVNGMIPLKISGIRKVTEHITSIDEVTRLID